MIREVIVSTLDEDGAAHIAPMGVMTESDGLTVIAPFRPSNTLNNLLHTNSAVVNRVTDVRIFAGCLTGRRDWPLLTAIAIDGVRLGSAISHLELRLDRFEEDEERPRFYMRTVLEETHAPFQGFNRAQSAVLEAAILVSRLGRLPTEKIDREVAYLQIAIDKTASKHEREAWQWLMDEIRDYRSSSGNTQVMAGDNTSAATDQEDSAT